jgi:hypothetical protein
VCNPISLSHPRRKSLVQSIDDNCHYLIDPRTSRLVCARAEPLDFIHLHKPTTQNTKCRPKDTTKAVNPSTRSKGAPPHLSHHILRNGTDSQQLRSSPRSICTRPAHAVRRAAAPAANVLWTPARPAVPAGTAAEAEEGSRVSDGVSGNAVLLLCL